MTSSWRHYMFLGIENFKFCKTYYRLSSLQASNLLVSLNIVTQTLWHDEIVLVYNSQYGPNVVELNYVEVNKENSKSLYASTPGSFAN